MTFPILNDILGIIPIQNFTEIIIYFNENPRTFPFSVKFYLFSST